MGADWSNVSKVTSLSYTCGYCGHGVASSLGYFSKNKIEGCQAYIYICSHCGKPTFFLGDERVPDVAPGGDVEHIDDPNIEVLYKEARSCISVGAYTASVMTSRKLLMNIAVNKGAAPNLRFVEYVQYLSNAHYVPPGGEEWVRHIKDKGNEANHEIHPMSGDDAKDLVTFIEMLLRLIYEFPNRVPRNAGR